MEHLIYFGIVFILVSLFYLLFLNRIRGKKEKVKDMGEISYIIAKFNLDDKKMNIKTVMMILGFINAFIIGFVCMVVAAIPLKAIWQLAIGFILLFGLVYSIYEIVGRILVRKGYVKNTKKMVKKDV